MSVCTRARVVNTGPSPTVPSTHGFHLTVFLCPDDWSLKDTMTFCVPQVNFQCGAPDQASNDVADRIADGENPDVDPDYYWRFQQMMSENREPARGSPATDGATSRSTASDGGTTRFAVKSGWECAAGGDLATIQGVQQHGHCQSSCEVAGSCLAYTYNSSSATCNLTSSPCVQQVQNPAAVLGIKEISVVQQTEEPAATFVHLQNIFCQGKTQKLIAANATQQLWRIPVCCEGQVRRILVCAVRGRLPPQEILQNRQGYDAVHWDQEKRRCSDFPELLSGQLP